jgi:hypothetical protein
MLARQVLYHQPCFVLGIFKIGSSKLFAWLALNRILLIPASSVARIIGMSHRCLAKIKVFKWLPTWNMAEISEYKGDAVKMSEVGAGGSYL